jgi:hypothetical protein
LLRRVPIRINGEEWLEGVFDNKFGYFPAIFVEPMFSLNDNNANFNNQDVSLYSSFKDEIDNAIKKEEEEEKEENNISLNTIKSNETISSTFQSPDFHKVP